MIAAAVLAAGASRRFGSPKQLALHEGEALVHRAARLAIEAGCDPVAVVVGAEGERVAAACAGLPLRFVCNDRWREGMARSIAAAIEAVASDESVRGLLLLAVDQPHLDAAILRRVLDAFDDAPGRIVATAYAGTRGIPALFSRDRFAALRALEGDRGAKNLILAEPAATIAIDWPPGAEDLDLRPPEG